MRILLATGIYPPDIGGPATYVQQLAARLHARDLKIVVLAYGENQAEPEGWPVHRVSMKGGPLLRWWRYAKALRTLGEDADIVYGFSGVSVGMPLLLSRLRGPRRILRLGGDFGWERATDAGETATLGQWYDKGPWQQTFLQILLKAFDYVVFSTAFQEAIYERAYKDLPIHSVIENALPDTEPVLHQAHEPFRLLFLGRFVAFKQLPMIIDAMTLLPDMSLTIVGDGPLQFGMEKHIADLSLQDRVTIAPPVSGQDKRMTFLSNDLLLLPSITEISPNVALEARGHGLPVLLTEETGLSLSLRQGMILEKLTTPEQLARAIQNVQSEYDAVAKRSSAPLPARPWDTVADEHVSLFQGLL